MKVTIDSSEPLTDTLRVVGATYNVTLEVASGTSSAVPSTSSAGKASSMPATKSRTPKARTPRKPTAGKRTSSGKTNASRPASTSTVRAWARENGYAVADRGRVPAEVVAAYRQAQSSG